MSIRHKQPADYYELLGVEKSASSKQIRHAYRKLARKVHPDVNNQFDAADRFAALNKAYKMLYDPETRRLYDETLRQKIVEDQMIKPAIKNLPSFDMGNWPEVFDKLREVLILVVCTALVIMYLFSVI